MPEETMTPRQRWLAVLEGEVPDRLPMDYWATGEATARLLDYLGCETLECAHRRLHVDTPLTVGPSYVGPPLPEGCNIYGVRQRTTPYEGGTYQEAISHPLAGYDSIEQIEADYTWPSADWYDYSDIADQVEGRQHRLVRAGGSEPFLVYKQLRGQQQAFMDLVLHPQIVHHCLDRLFDFCYERTRRVFEQIPGRVDISYVAEDMGGQEGLLMSKEHIRRFLLPRMKRMMDLVHQAGAAVFFHSDGAILDIIPEMIETGIDVLNPIQWRCRGMDRAEIKGRFGHRVALHGAMDNQYTLAFGSMKEVRAEARENVEILGQGGGYILAPCHNIQALTPPQNVVAMYETAYELGWY